MKDWKESVLDMRTDVLLDNVGIRVDMSKLKSTTHYNGLYALANPGLAWYILRWLLFPGWQKTIDRWLEEARLLRQQEFLNALLLLAEEISDIVVLGDCHTPGGRLL